MGGIEQYCNDNKITMGNQGEEKQIFNVYLAKIIGLYQILDPRTVKYRGYNVFHVTVTIFILYVGFISIAMAVNGAYYLNNVRSSSLINFIGSISIYNMYYKIFVVFRHSRRIWDCLLVTRFNFTKHERHDGGQLLDIWRNRSIRVTYVYSFINIIVMLGFVMIPIVFNHTTVEIENRNGSMNNYRINVLNLHLLALFDDVKYNQYFVVLYIFEGMTVVITIILNFIGDIILITLSLALMCQLQMVCTAIDSLGHKTISGCRSSANVKRKRELTVELDVYNDLITIIKDHQAVIQKIDVFFNIFGWPMFIQICISSVNIIFSWFTITVNITSGEIAEMGTMLILQLFSAIPLFLFQLYIPCSLFGRIHDQKDCIIFSLYSSNWTEMNLKCKKLILFMMMMNNAHQKKLKFTSQYIVNMEMFCRTLRICYTSLSMLLNYRKLKYNNSN